MDLLRATSILYGDCTQDPSENTIYIKGKALTKTQLKKVTAKAKELEEQEKATQYQRDRKAEYDKLNQDELRFDDLVNGTTTWIDAINNIKKKYPKPTQGIN